MVEYPGIANARPISGLLFKFVCDGYGNAIQLTPGFTIGSIKADIAINKDVTA